MNSAEMIWPADADGDVFRRLLAFGFDFGRAVSVNYVVDFEVWPPSREALDMLASMFGTLRIVEPDDHEHGRVEFEERGLLRYDRVASVQSQVCDAMLPFGGICDSWGVLH